ncbi:MAG: FAD binding domain-containing protein [Candidatus Omnitrophica bacterium]|nr:FAD binding domain-containing protein [Candidatus Omnitrophota bacterium]
MLLNPLTFHTPDSLEELLKLHSSLENAKIQAGGTFLLNSLKLLKRKGSKTPEHIISLYKVPELKGISADAKGLTIGAGTTIDEIAETPLEGHFQILHTVCKNISTQPIRNVATMGGNLTCRYTWTEMPAVLIGLRGTMIFVDENGTAEEVCPEEFFKNAAKTQKILKAVHIPADAEASVAYRRIRKSQGVDIPLLSLLINTRIKNNQWTDTVVAVNNCTAFAQRDSKLEEFLNGSKNEASIADEALNNLTESIYDTRSNEYKQHIFRVSLKSAIKEIVTTHKG